MAVTGWQILEGGNDADGNGEVDMISYDWFSRVGLVWFTVEIDIENRYASFRYVLRRLLVFDVVHHGLCMKTMDIGDDQELNYLKMLPRYAFEI